MKETENLTKDKMQENTSKDNFLDISGMSIRDIYKTYSFINRAQDSLASLVYSNFDESKIPYDSYDDMTNESIDYDISDVLGEIAQEEHDLETVLFFGYRGWWDDYEGEFVDTSPEVRIAVAQQGYALDKLMNDEDYDVRATVAKQGYGLDKLVNDREDNVRVAVADQGYGLEQLVNDESPNVRVAVAKQGYGLDTLVNDKDIEVRIVALKQSGKTDKLDPNLKKELIDHIYEISKKQNINIQENNANDKSKNSAIKNHIKEDNLDSLYMLYDIVCTTNNSYIIKEIIEQDFDINKLIDSENSNIRQSIAKRGYCLDKFVNDKDASVRRAVAQQGYGLDKLVNDEDPYVRIAVAEQGYNIDQLVNDKNLDVRITLAQKGYALDKLVNDKSPKIREIVAQKGYGLEKLVNDKDVGVYLTACKRLGDADVANKYREITQEKYDELCKRTTERLNEEFKPYCINRLINHKNPYVRIAVAEQGYGLDKLITDKDYNVRKAVARQGYGLEELIKDEDRDVRIAVAQQGYGLEKLIDDKEEWVRVAVAEQRYGLNKLVGDKSIVVRRAVAKQGYGLKRLVNDKDWWVRKAVAEQGYGIDKLIYDKDESVRKMAEQMYYSSKYMSAQTSLNEEEYGQNEKYNKEEMNSINQDIKDTITKLVQTKKNIVKVFNDSSLDMLSKIAKIGEMQKQLNESTNSFIEKITENPVIISQYPEEISKNLITSQSVSKWLDEIIQDKVQNNPQNNFFNYYLNNDFSVSVAESILNNEIYDVATTPISTAKSINQENEICKSEMADDVLSDEETFDFTTPENEDRTK